MLLPPFGDPGPPFRKLLLLPPPPLNHIGIRRPRKISATTPPPPPLNHIGIRRPRKMSATTPPPPLNRVDLALGTKGAPSLGKSWICDCTVYYKLLYKRRMGHNCITVGLPMLRLRVCRTTSEPYLHKARRTY